MTIDDCHTVLQFNSLVAAHRIAQTVLDLVPTMIERIKQLEAEIAVANETTDW